MQKLIFAWVASFALTFRAVAAPTTPPPAPQTFTWEYPELAVAPRASERLERETRLEMRRGIDEFWQVGISGLTTLTSGVLALGGTRPTVDPDKGAAWTSIGIGGTWVAAAIALPMLYNPYARGYDEIAKMPKGSQREQLARERAAEESIHGAARTGAILKWLSVGSNVGAGLNLLRVTESGSLAQISGIMATGAALLPLLFEHRWTRVDREQRDYKKRIFGPLAGPLTVRDGAGVSLSWRF